MLYFPHEISKDSLLWLLPLIYVLKGEDQDIFYVGATDRTLQERLYGHKSEAWNGGSNSFYSPKNKRIRQEKRWAIEALFHAPISLVERYEMASVEVLSETYQLTNVRRRIHHQFGLYGRTTEASILAETREKIQAYVLLHQLGKEKPYW